MFAVRQSEMWYKPALPYPSPLAKGQVGNKIKRNRPHPAAGGVWRPCKCGYSRVMPQLQAPWQCMNSTAVGKIHTEDFANTFGGWNFCPRGWSLLQLWERGLLVIYSWGQGRARARKFVLQQFIPYLVYRCKQKIYTSYTKKHSVDREGEGYTMCVHTYFLSIFQEGQLKNPVFLKCL